MRKRKISPLPALISGGIVGGIFFLIIAFAISQMGQSFSSDRQIKNTLTFIFFDTPTILFRYPAELAGYHFSSGISFVLTFILYAIFGALISFIMALLLSKSS